MSDNESGNDMMSDNDIWMAMTFANRRRATPEEEADAAVRLQMIREKRLIYIDFGQSVDLVDQSSNDQI